MQRREFLGRAATVLFAGAAVQILGCGADSAYYVNGFGSGTGGTPGSGDRIGVIGAPDVQNHSVPGQHVAILTEAEIAKGRFMILSIKGYADHEHTIALSEAEQRDIANGIAVSKTSTDANNHYHSVKFN